MDNEAVLVQDLVKRYGTITAVNGISFSVRKGEVFGLLGPNGAGKTTTLECLEGIRIPDNGQMRVAGCDPRTDSRAMRSKLGVQLQSSSLPDSMRTDEAMALICAWHAQSPRFDLLIRFGLEASFKKQYHTLSTGQKRRLHLALALAHNPEVIILDEPTAGLDVQGRAQLHDAIRELKNNGLTVLLATHDMAEAEALCDRLAILIQGKLAVIGTPAQVTAKGNPETRIIIRTTKESLLPGGDIGLARFIKEAEGYGEWVSTDVAASLTEILRKVQLAGDEVEDLRVQRPSLEERFLELVEGGGLK
jgi:ABC-2 type transport system ATP-binding protein